MKLFKEDELKACYKQGLLSLMESKILSVATNNEPTLVQYWMCRKQSKPVPTDVMVKAGFRLSEMILEAGLPLTDGWSEDDQMISNVCESIWKKIYDKDDQDESM